MTHFLISDTHFGHANIITFKRDDGAPLRDFKSVEEMDETIIANWNNTVKPTDTVYHLGDVVINRRCLSTVGRLNGRKKLVRGNHDLFKLADYTPYFEDVYGVYVLKDIILSHIPLHRECLTERFGTNVHGHLHSNRVMRHSKLNEEYVIDKKYFSVCVEQINYTPISLEELRLKIKED